MNHYTQAKILPGIIFLLGAIYIWGGLVLDPEGVEYLLAGNSLSQSWTQFGNFYLVGILSLIFGIGVWAAMGLKNDAKDSDNRKLALSFLLLSLLSVPANWVLTGFGGIFLSLLIVIQNFSALSGLFLISAGIGKLLGGRFKPIRIFKRDIGLGIIAAVGALFFILTAFVGKSVFGWIPHVGDGAVQLFQAKMYALGKVWVDIPDNIEFFFETFLADKDGRWFSQYPPGYALLLTAGIFLGNPALVNPLLAGITAVLFGLILKEVGLSRWWILLFILSPFVIFMSGSFMNHPATMFWGALGIWAFLKSRRDKTGWLLLWGLAAGMMFSVRPWTAVCFNIPLIFLALRKRIGMGILAAALGAVIGALPFFIVNHAAAGSFFTSGYQVAWDGASGLFFSQPQWGPQHTPQLGALHLLNMVRGLNTMLLEIPIPALLGVSLWILYARDKSWREWALFWAGIFGFAGYFFYFYNDMTYGPRFAYASAFPLLIISAAGLKAYYHHLRSEHISASRGFYSFFAAFIILIGLWAAVSLPARIKFYYDNYRDVGMDFIEAIKAENINNALVFLDDYPSTDRHARLVSLGFSNRQAWYYSWRLSDQAVAGALSELGIKPEDGFGKVAPLPELGRRLNQYWGNSRFAPHPQEDMTQPYIPLKQGFIYMNPLIAENDIIYARSFGAHNRKLKEKYPERDCYFAYRDTSGVKLIKIQP